MLLGGGFLLNDLFKALADPTRRKILDLLKERDLTAGEIASHFNMSKPSISQHLNILKQSNLVKNRKRREVCLLHIKYNRCSGYFELAYKY